MAARAVCRDTLVVLSDGRLAMRKRDFTYTWVSPHLVDFVRPREFIIDLDPETVQPKYATCPFRAVNASDGVHLLQLPGIVFGELCGGF